VGDKQSPIGVTRPPDFVEYAALHSRAVPYGKKTALQPVFGSPGGFVKKTLGKHVLHHLEVQEYGKAWKPWVPEVGSGWCAGRHDVSHGGLLR
jgi:hypothetical protein